MARSTYIYTLMTDMSGSGDFILHGHYTVKREAVHDGHKYCEASANDYPTIRIYRSKDGSSPVPKEPVLIYETDHL